jgi:phospholipase/carboxylesterase
MTTSLPHLDGPRLPPAARGPARQLVVLLHGYGADGNDVLPLAQHWQRLLPNAAFAAPHGPEACAEGPMGRQWFPLAIRDLGAIAAGLEVAAPTLGAFIDGELRRLGLPSRALALAGFSQGAMLALRVGPARTEPIAGIVSYAGLIAGPVRPANPGRPPVLLYHGAGDPLIPATALTLAQAALTAAGLPVEAEIRQGLGHGIDQLGIELGGRFLRRVLAETAGEARPANDR